MSGEEPLIEHAAPALFPSHHYAAIAIPQDFARVIVEASIKNGMVFEDQLLAWAIMGAEHSRLCKK